MKKLKYLLIILAVLLVVPFGVLAEGEEAPADGAGEQQQEEVSKKVKVYFFHGETCPHCQEGLAWFEEITPEHGDKFELVKYEVWNNQENAELMERVGEFRNEEAKYVPYILIGDKMWNGFAESMEDEFLEAINTEYEKDPADRYDIMYELENGEPVKSTTGRDILILLGFITVISAIVVGVMFTSKKVQ